MPVVRDEAHVFTVAVGEHHRGFKRGFAEHGETLLVVGEVGAVGLSVQLRSGLAPHLGQEQGVVHEHAVNALLVLVEVSDLLAEGVNLDRGVPSTLVLVVPGGDGHHFVPALGELDRERADDVTEAAGLGPGCNLGGHEHDLHGLVRLGGVGGIVRGASLWVEVGGNRSVTASGRGLIDHQKINCKKPACHLNRVRNTNANPSLGGALEIRCEGGRVASCGCQSVRLRE